jgi:hypothetical protein
MQYMADERRVLSVGLDLSEKENKNEIKINREIKINNDNTDSLLNIIDMIIDSISDGFTVDRPLICVLPPVFPKPLPL